MAALSAGIVALAIWDKVAVPPEAEPSHAVGTARVLSPADAPVAQLDLSREAAGVPEESGGQSPEHPPSAAKSDARAAGRPVANPHEPHTMTEEERSARNEELIGGLERQKKLWGMKVLPKASAHEEGGEPAERGRLVAPVVRAPAPTLLKDERPKGAAAAATSADTATGPGRLAPDAALVFSDGGGLASSWVLLGLPGAPPAMDFSKERLVVIKPSATKILSVTPGPGAVTVVYRSLFPDEDANPARDRAAILPAQPKTVLIYDATPR